MSNHCLGFARNTVAPLIPPRPTTVRHRRRQNARGGREAVARERPATFDWVLARVAADEELAQAARPAFNESRSVRRRTSC